MFRIKIAIADDHAIVRDGIKILLEQTGNFEVIIEAADGQELIDYLEKGFMVEVILMDISMPKVDGISATKIIKKQWSQVKVIALTVHDSIKIQEKFFNSGGDYYLFKGANPNELISLIEKAAAKPDRSN